MVPCSCSPVSRTSTRTTSPSLGSRASGVISAASALARETRSRYEVISGRLRGPGPRDRSRSGRRRRGRLSPGPLPPGKGDEGGGHDVAGVHLEESAQGLSGVGAPEAVGAQCDERPGHPLRDLVGHRLHVVGHCHDRPADVGEQPGHHRDPLLIVRVQRFHRSTRERASSRRLLVGRRRPQLGAHPVVLRELLGPPLGRRGFAEPENRMATFGPVASGPSAHLYRPSMIPSAAPSGRGGWV